MKRAGYEVFKFINNKFKKRQSIIVLCGPGNNGGDGFVTANYLLNKGYKIARRTVAKYREIMKIPSSAQRRRQTRLAAIN